jgi:monoterpene epsilon-lactone hydrolase
MIRDFDEVAKKQKANVTLEVWENMTHDFQAYGDLVPESKEALNRLGEIVRKYCG